MISVWSLQWRHSTHRLLNLSPLGQLLDYEFSKELFEKASVKYKKKLVYLPTICYKKKYFFFVIQVCISPNGKFTDIIWATVAERDEVRALIIINLHYLFLLQFTLNGQLNFYQSLYLNQPFKRLASFIVQNIFNEINFARNLNLQFPLNRNPIPKIRFPFV